MNKQCITKRFFEHIVDQPWPHDISAIEIFAKFKSNSNSKFPVHAYQRKITNIPKNCILFLVYLRSEKINPEPSHGMEIQSLLQTTPQEHTKKTCFVTTMSSEFVFKAKPQVLEFPSGCLSNSVFVATFRVQNPETLPEKYEISFLDILQYNGEQFANSFAVNRIHFLQDLERHMCLPPGYRVHNYNDTFNPNEKPHFEIEKELSAWIAKIQNAKEENENDALYECLNDAFSPCVVAIARV